MSKWLFLFQNAPQESKFFSCIVQRTYATMHKRVEDVTIEYLYFTAENLKKIIKIKCF